MKISMLKIQPFIVIKDHSITFFGYNDILFLFTPKKRQKDEHI
jgi:hypothetical protein